MQPPNPRRQAVLAPGLSKRLDDLVISLTIRCRDAREDGTDPVLAADLARIDFLARRCRDAFRRPGPDGTEERLAAETGGRVVTAVRERRGDADAVEQAWLLSLFLPDDGSVRWVDGLPVTQKEQASGSPLTLVSARPAGSPPGEGLVVGLARDLSTGIGILVPDGDRLVAIGVLAG